MLPPKSQGHRLQVLANLTRLAEGTVSSDESRGGDQLRMPLLVEVKQVASLKQPGRRGRPRAPVRQLDLDNL